MRKLATKLAAVVTLILFLMIYLFQTVIAATKEDFESVNSDQKAYYNNVYVPAYQAYNQALHHFRERVYATDFETVEQAQRVLNFLNELKQRRFDFFGNRETVGKSRYEVPRVREAMYAAAQAGQYDQAIALCQQLKQLVVARVNFLNGLAAEIQNFNIIDNGQPTTTTTTTTTATTTTYASAPKLGIVFHANNIWSSYSFGFKITITNQSGQDISDWNLAFAINGATINSVWIDGGALSYQMHGNGTFQVKPFNQYQNGYTIPAGGSVVIFGNANGDANQVQLSGATFNGQPVSISYLK